MARPWWRQRLPSSRRLLRSSMPQKRSRASGDGTRGIDRRLALESRRTYQFKTAKQDWLAQIYSVLPEPMTEQCGQLIPKVLAFIQLLHPAFSLSPLHEYVSVAESAFVDGNGTQSMAHFVKW